MSDESAMDAVYGLVGTGVATQETVPTAFAIIGSRAGRGTRDGPTWRPRGWAEIPTRSGPSLARSSGRAPAWTPSRPSGSRRSPA